MRGAHDPRSGNGRTHNVRSAIIPKDDLFDGNLSVWRLEPDGISCVDLVDKLDRIPGQTLFALCGISASQIRNLEIDGKRALSVVDEIQSDRDGGTHPAHAHIALCKAVVGGGMEKTSPEYEQLRTELYGSFKGSPIWLRLKPANNP